jgi:iron(III) transport system substrate-binding protein
MYKQHRPALCAAALALLIPAFYGCTSKKQQEVVVYTALDRLFSEPILNRFEEQTSIRVLAKYDSEATKTVGLVNAIRAEKDRPRCDVFWNNEIVNTIRLKNEGLLQPFTPDAAAPYPATFKDPDGCWHGFAARARVFLVNTNLVPAAEMPRAVTDLSDSRWKGRTGIAKPLFGTTATHAACLFAQLGEDKTRSFFESLKKNDIQVMSGNKGVALAVSSGQLAFGLTDTDDAIIEVEAGNPVKIVFPDSATDGEGALFIPNTLSLVKGAPNADAGKRLMEYLLSPEVEETLAAAESAQICINPNIKTRSRVMPDGDVKAMPVDFGKAAQEFDRAAAYIEQFFLR